MKGTPENTLVELLNVPRETIQNLRVYVEQLEKWNRKINLVGRATISEIWSRHILDSAQLLSRISKEETWTDMGSGAGFPGLVIAILSRDQDQPLDMAMIESDSRKCEFLRHVSRLVNTPVSVVNERIEVADIRRADVVSARALASLPKLVEYAHPKLNADGTCLFLKGSNIDTELTEAARIWHIDYNKFPSITDSDGVVLQVRNIRHV